MKMETVKIKMKVIGFVILVSMLSMAIPQMNKNEFTVQAAKVKKVTALKKSKVVDGTHVYSKDKQYAGCYRKIKWKKVKGAKGYQVFRYNYLTKKWKKILTTKKNSFKITDMCDGEKVKLKVRAYGKNKKKMVYGTFSKALAYTESTYLHYTLNEKVIQKNSYASGKDGYHLSCDQQAFLLQNEYRKKAGVTQLKWSDVLYEICKARTKDIIDGFSHEKFESTAQKVLKSKYGYTDWMLRGKTGGTEYRFVIINGENIYGGSHSPMDSVTAWSKSNGHYDNMIHKDYRYGAIASYHGYWVAIFSMVDVDEIVKNDNMKSVKSAVKILAEK